MGRKVIATYICLVMVLSFIVIIIEIASVVEAPTTWFVDDVPGSGGPGDPPEDFTSIQDAINASIDGDTVFVYNGTYYEHVTVNKSINLTGENRDTTIINGGGSGIVVYVNASWVNITGFNVTECDWNEAGIQLQNVNNCNIFTNNLTSYKGYQIYLVSSSNNNITDNNVLDSKFGIYLVSSYNNSISHNNARNGYSIYLDSSSNNSIKYNSITDIMDGITIESSYDNIIAYNNVSSKDESGIHIWKSSRNNITANNITNSTWGIRLSISQNNTISANNIFGHLTFPQGPGILLASSSFNKILHNNISSSGNGLHLVSSSNNTILWNNISKNSEGMFLSKSSNNTIMTNIVSFNRDNGINIMDSFGHLIKDNNVSSNEQRGISIWNSTNTTVTGNNISFNRFDGISVGQSFDNNLTNNKLSYNEGGIRVSDGSSNNNIAGNNISFNKGFGVSLISSSNISILNNVFIKDGVFLSGSELYHFNTHNIPINNVVNGRPLRYYKNINGMNIDGDIIDVGELILVNCTDIIAGNLKINDTDVGIELAFTTNSTILNNNITSNDIQGIGLWFSHNNTVKNNNISTIVYLGISVALPMIDGIFLYSSSNNNVSNNNISNSTGIGICLHSSINNIVSNNGISNNSFMGIFLEIMSSKTTILDNNITSNLYGIVILSSLNITVTRNSITSNELGILFYLSDNSIIRGNIISNNFTGIYLDSSHNNTIICNNISHNLNGINLTSSSGNLIYRNNFIGNTEQTYDNRSDNYWDNGYPSGGNFWSDYKGDDLFRGPDQDIPGNDGIGDINYTIDDDSKDNYPLMSPVGDCIFLYKGWNLISIPLIQENQSLVKVLEMIGGYYDSVQWYDTIDSNDPWKHNNIGKSFGNDLSQINESMGFWIHINHPGDTIFLYNGTQPTSNQTISLHPGWNMVGYPSLTSYNRTEGLNNMTFNDQVDAIWFYDAAIQKWEQMGESDYFQIGKGYYIHAKSECEWEVPFE